MKKLKILTILLIIFTAFQVSAKEIVTLNKCVDGDTAWFNLNGEKIKARFLAVDTPESTNKIEEYGKQASEFTCNLLSNANKIEIEYDENSDKLDKYDRHLVWVFVDDNLLQDLIIKEGLAEVHYIYGNYKYTSILEKSEKEAKSKRLNIWSEKTNNNELLITIGIIIFIIIIYILSPKKRKKINKKVKNKIDKEINKKIDELL